VQWLGLSVPASVQAAWDRQASANPQRRKSVNERPFFPNFLLRELMAWYIALGVLGALAALYPWSLGVEADPFAPAPAGIKPEWYFLFMFQTLKLLPAKIGPIDGEVLGIIAFCLAGVLLLLVPFLGQGWDRLGRLITGAGIFALVYMLSMTVYGFLAK
jgi:cytochrome b6